MTMIGSRNQTSSTHGLRGSRRAPATRRARPAGQRAGTAQGRMSALERRAVGELKRLRPHRHESHGALRTRAESVLERVKHLV